MASPAADKVYPEGTDYYSVMPFQLQVLHYIERGHNWYEIAEWCGVTRDESWRGGNRKRRGGDSGYLKVVLGMRECKSGSRPGARSVKRTVSYDLAVRLCRGLGLDYHDIGV